MNEWENDSTNVYLGIKKKEFIFIICERSYTSISINELNDFNSLHIGYIVVFQISKYIQEPFSMNNRNDNFKIDALKMNS